MTSARAIGSLKNNNPEMLLPIGGQTIVWDLGENLPVVHRKSCQGKADISGIQSFFPPILVSEPKLIL